VASMRFLLISKRVIALLLDGVSANARRGYSGTYVHLGRKAATIWAS
jgi:hypothetical protein